MPRHSNARSETTRQIVRAVSSGAKRTGKCPQSRHHADVYAGAFTPLVKVAADRAIDLFFATVFGEQQAAAFSQRPYAEDLRIDLVRLFGDYVPAILIDEVERLSDDSVIGDLRSGNDKPEYGPDDAYYLRQFESDDDDDSSDDEDGDEDEDDGDSQDLVEDDGPCGTHCKLFPNLSRHGRHIGSKKRASAASNASGASSTSTADLAATDASSTSTAAAAVEEAQA